MSSVDIGGSLASALIWFPGSRLSYRIGIALNKGNQNDWIVLL